MIDLHRIYTFITVLLLVDFALYLSHGISLPGQMIDFILFWSWLLLTPVLIFKKPRIPGMKYYALTLGLLIVLSLIPMGVPFLTIFAFATDFDGNDSKLVENYRLQENAKSVIAIPKIEVIKPRGLIEQKIGEMEFWLPIGEQDYRLQEAKEITVREVNDSLEFNFTFETGSLKRVIDK